MKPARALLAALALGYLTARLTGPRYMPASFGNMPARLDTHTGELEAYNGQNWQPITAPTAATQKSSASNYLDAKR